MYDSAREHRKQKWATRLVLFIFGFALSTWAPLIPFVQARLAFDDGQLGLLILCLGVGSIVAMPVAGILAARYGCRPVLDVAVLLVCLALPVLAASSGALLLPAALFLFGASVGTLDCVVNMQAVVVERESGRKMMSGFHSIFSLGCILGAGTASALLSLGVQPRDTAALACVVIVAIYLFCRSGVFIRRVERSGPAIAFPRGSVMFIGILCFIAFLAEGAILDWGAVFLVNERSVDRTSAGIGYAIFAVAMMVGRMSGDFCAHRWGYSAVGIAGGLLAAAGFLVAIALQYPSAALFGYGMVGLGIANLAPIFLSAAGRQTDMPEYLAVPAIVTMGYSGILVGPAMLGFIAHATSLPIAFAAVAILLVLLCVAIALPRKASN